MCRFLRHARHVDGLITKHWGDLWEAGVLSEGKSMGGATTFPKHDFSIQPKAGRIVIFPVHWLHPHKGEVPLSSHKTILTTFIRQG